VLNIGSDQTDWLKFGSEVVELSVYIKFRNIGNGPAICVTPFVKLVPFQGAQAVAAQRAYCCELRKKKFSTGFTMFPMDTYPREGETKKIRFPARGEAAAFTGEAFDGARGKRVRMSLVGCIDYTFGSDQTNHHQTGFIYELHMIGDDSFLICEDGMRGDMIVFNEPAAYGGWNVD
jgi:hypothetical protein